MGMAAINSLRALHDMVIHKKDYSEEKELRLDWLESYKIGQIKSDVVLSMICPSCFPNTQEYQAHKQAWKVAVRNKHR